MTHDDPEEIALRAHRAAIERLEEAVGYMCDENEGSNLSASFCGCDDCYVRECLHAAWPHLYELANHPDTDGA